MKVKDGNVMALLAEAHDLMDDDNAWAKEFKTVAGQKNARCRWCRAEGYDGTGLHHTDDCILVRIRQALNAATEIV